MYERICRLKNEKERVISEFEMGFKKSCLSSSLNSNYTRSENWYGLKRPGLKTGVENYIFLSEIGSGFGEAGDTRPQKILKNPPPPPPHPGYLPVI